MKPHNFVTWCAPVRRVHFHPNSVCRGRKLPSASTLDGGGPEHCHHLCPDWCSHAFLATIKASAAAQVEKDMRAQRQSLFARDKHQQIYLFDFPSVATLTAAEQMETHHWKAMCDVDSDKHERRRNAEGEKAVMFVWSVSKRKTDGST